MPGGVGIPAFRTPDHGSTAGVLAAPADLTAAQTRAVTHLGGPVLVLGAAGTGKTAVLVARFAWLVAQGAAPESILVLSPSSAAAAALRGRVEDALHRPYEELAVHSVRGLCTRLLRDEIAESGVDPFFAPATRADRLAVLLLAECRAPITARPRSRIPKG